MIQHRVCDTVNGFIRLLGTTELAYKIIASIQPVSYCSSPQAPFDHIWAMVWSGARGNITI